MRASITRTIPSVLAIMTLLTAHAPCVKAWIQVRRVSDLSELNTEGRRLEVGSESQGRLTEADALLNDDTYAQAWALEGTRGGSVTVNLLSDDFDALLLLMGPGIKDAITDDDGAGGCNSRITVEFPADGTYRVIVNTISERATGSFTLRTDERPGPVSDEACLGEDFGRPDVAELSQIPLAAEQLLVGAEVHGELSTEAYGLTNGNRAQAWPIAGTRGVEVTVDLISNEFDTFLYIIGPGIEDALRDDDGGGACNARITFDFPETGTYRVIASSFGEWDTGSFTLRVSERPGPMSDGPCPGDEPDILIEDAESLSELPFDGRQLQVGSEVQSELSTEDYLRSDGTYAQAWGLSGAVGATVTVYLISDDFDAHLILIGPGIDWALSDDDSGGGLNSCIRFEFPETGTYRVIVNTLGEAETGSFTLRASEQAEECLGGEFDVEALSELPTDGRQVELGTEVEGQLTTDDYLRNDETYAQAWDLTGTAGTEATIDLISDEFDSYLLLVGPGIETPLTDDDGGGSCNSRITLEFPEAGTYRVIVNTIGQVSTGQFTLRVSDKPGPTAPGVCQMMDLLDAETIGILENLRPEGRTLETGVLHRGELTADDATAAGSHVQAWGLTGREGQSVTVDLISTDFDAFLLLLGPGLEQPMADDDGGGACNARITITYPVTGDYTVVVTTVDEGAAGNFALRVTDTPSPMVPGPCQPPFEEPDLSDKEDSILLSMLPNDGRTIAVGREVEGTLSSSDAVHNDGSHVQAWLLEARTGQEVTIDLISEEFDAYLFVLGPDLDELLSDDDNGGRCNSRITLTFPADGNYSVVVNSLAPEETGRFILRVSERPAPAMAGECGL